MASPGDIVDALALRGGARRRASAVARLMSNFGDAIRDSRSDSTGLPVFQNVPSKAVFVHFDRVALAAFAKMTPRPDLMLQALKESVLFSRTIQTAMVKHNQDAARIRPAPVAERG